jgi:hypothetical protein
MKSNDNVVCGIDVHKKFLVAALITAGGGRSNRPGSSGETTASCANSPGHGTNSFRREPIMSTAFTRSSKPWGSTGHRWFPTFSEKQDSLSCAASLMELRSRRLWNASLLPGSRSRKKFSSMRCTPTSARSTEFCSSSIWRSFK